MSLVWVSSAPAQTAVPATVQIEDLENDGNFVNDQGLNFCGVAQGATPPCFGDEGVGQDASTVGDFLKIWFSNTETDLSLHILTQAVPPASTTLQYRIFSNPATEPAQPFGCLFFQAVFAGVAQGQDVSTYRGANYGGVTDRCSEGGGTRVDGTVTTETLGEGGLTTITVPRSASPLFADGKSIELPYAESRIFAGAEGVATTTVLQIDNTKRGATYEIESGGDEPQPQPTTCSSKNKKNKKGKKGKGQQRPSPKPTPRPTGSPSASGAPTTPPPAPEMMMQTPTPSASATAKPTSPPGQQKSCPRQKGKNKPKPRPNPKPKPTRPRPSSTPSGSTAPTPSATPSSL